MHLVGKGGCLEQLLVWVMVFVALCVMRGVGGGGRVVADTSGGSAIVVTRTSTSEVASVLRVNIESIPVSGLGLSMLECKADGTEDLIVVLQE
ncbi:hypothetical protein Tco_0228074 [Tanacetum coccineum]